MKKLLLVLITALLSVPVYAQNDEIAPELTDEELISYLQDNYSVTSSKSYSAARDAMFEEIDGPDGMITCVYTGFTISFTDRQDAQGSQAAGDFNTEHIWPQSFFDSELPMRSDIHHLYPTRVDVNGARSNYPFDEIDDNRTSTWYRNGTSQSSIPASNIDEYSELLSGTSFEPREDHKGNVARAIFYFWTIYQNNTDITTDNTDNAAFFEGMKDVLLSWHITDPVDETEVARSTGIEAVQGNRNPFIHDTTLVRRAYFGAGPVGTNTENGSDLPGSVLLEQNYPNPFNPTTEISYQISDPEKVRLSVYNLLGREVAVLVNGIQAPGTYNVTFNASGLPSGIYMYQLKTTSQNITRRMTLIK